MKQLFFSICLLVSMFTSKLYAQTRFINSKQTPMFEVHSNEQTVLNLFISQKKNKPFDINQYLNQVYINPKSENFHIQLNTEFEELVIENDSTLNDLLSYSIDILWEFTYYSINLGIDNIHKLYDNSFDVEPNSLFEDNSLGNLVYLETTTPCLFRITFSHNF